MRPRRVILALAAVSVMGACGPDDVAAETGETTEGPSEDIQLGPISCGVAHSCVVDQSGEVWCWGRDVSPVDVEPGPEDRPGWLAELGEFDDARSVWTDWLETCVVDGQGGLWCYSYLNVELTRIEGIDDAIDVRGDCVLRASGGVLCQSGFWLSPEGVQSEEPSDLGGMQAIGLARGSQHHCVLDSEGVAWCWSGSYTPGAEQAVDAPVGFVAIDAGTGSTCGLSDAHEVWCWDASDTPTPQQIQGLSDIETLAVGNASGCAVDSEGALWCWEDPLAPALVDIGPAVDVDLSRDHGCAILADERIACWGANEAGQAGALPPLPDGSVHEVELDGVTAIDVHDKHACAVLDDHSAWCWGQPSESDEPTPTSGAPRHADWLPPVVAVRPGEGIGCALGMAQDLWCWGWLDLAQNAPVPFSQPMRLDELEPVESVAVGGSAYCAEQGGGTVTCVGGYGLCPNEGTFEFGTMSDQLAVGSGHGCVLVDGEVQCWAVMQADFNSCEGPQVVPQLSGSTAISTGYRSLCGVLPGRIRCIAASGPSFDDETLGDFQAMDIGVEGTINGPIEHICAVTADEGRLECSNWAELVDGLVDITDVAVGGNFGCALDSSGRVNCWGSNGVGQLGHPGTTWVDPPHTFALHE